MIFDKFKIVYRPITTLFYKKIIERQKYIINKIPKYKLDKIHIQNARLLINREEMISLFPKNGICAELGVGKGDFSKNILEMSSPQKLHLIDLWGTQRYNDEMRIYVENYFKDEISKGVVEINVGMSTDIVDKFENN